MPSQKVVDAVIIGGGPAGLAASLALRGRGLDCLVVDQNVPAIDKACGEGLMPDALESIAKLGVRISPSDGAPFVGIRFCDRKSSVQSTFPHGTAVGIKRTQLHQRLVHAAGACGVQFAWNTKAKFLDTHNVQVGDQLIRAKWIVGADGQHSRVRARFGLGEELRCDTRFGIRRHFAIEPWTDRVEVHWEPSGQMYVTPVKKNEVCVAFVSATPGLRMEEALIHFPDLHARLAGAAAGGPDRASITTTRQLLRVCNQSVALVGDASGSVDAVTGEGIAIAFRQAVALADAIESNNPAAYQLAHEQIMKLPMSMSSLLLLLDRFPRLRGHALQALSASPEMFEKLLSAHVGHANLWPTVLQEAPRFSWNLLRTVT